MATPKGLEMSLAEIAPFGDVVFLVGPDKIKLQVVSGILRILKVFEAMLGSNFAEGQGHNCDSPKEIDLPEDDAKAL
jgi:hypothetical protein